MEAIECRVDVGRHRLFDNFDAAARVVHQVFGNERLAERLDPTLFNDTLAGVSLKGLNSRKLLPWPPFAHNPKFSQNLRKLTLFFGAGLLEISARDSTRPLPYGPSIFTNLLTCTSAALNPLFVYVVAIST